MRAETVDGVPTVYLAGELDSYSAPRLRALLESLVAPPRPAFLVDLSGLEYIDSVGLGVLVAGLKQASDRAGVMALVGPTPTVERVLRVTGLDKVFLVFADETQAQAFLRPQAA